MRNLILLLALCACASGTQASGTTVTPVAIYTSPETGTLFSDRPHPTATTLDAAPAAVWLAVKKVYADLDIPVTLENPATHQIGNTNIIKSRQMAGKPMTTWVDCGSSMTGQKAAEYRITAALVTDVLPNGKGGTTVQTTFTPSGRDVSEGSSDQIVCASTGHLEQVVLDQVKALVSHP